MSDDEPPTLDYIASSSQSRVIALEQDLAALAKERDRLKTERDVLNAAVEFLNGNRPDYITMSNLKLEHAAALARAEKWKQVANGLAHTGYHGPSCRSTQNGCECGWADAISSFDALVKEDDGPLVTAIKDIKSRHPEACDEAKQLMDEAVKSLNPKSPLDAMRFHIESAIEVASGQINHYRQSGNAMLEEFWLGRLVCAKGLQFDLEELERTNSETPQTQVR